jgi:hypothetical protein
MSSLPNQGSVLDNNEQSTVGAKILDDWNLQPRPMSVMAILQQLRAREPLNPRKTETCVPYFHSSNR